VSPTDAAESAKGLCRFDLNLGCSGYVYGLWVASQLLKSLGGTRALLLVGDTSTSLLAPGDRSVQFLFGDAGTATALECRQTRQYMTFVLGTDGAGAPPYCPGGVPQQLDSKSLIGSQGRDGHARCAADLLWTVRKCSTSPFARCRGC